MFGYRLYVFELYVAASQAALDLGHDFDECLKTETPADGAAALRVAAADLQRQIEALRAAFPESIREPSSETNRHLRFLRYYLDKKQPGSCRHDVSDLATSDLPAEWESFAKWYEANSSNDAAFVSRVSALMGTGDAAGALRLAWPIFKTRVVTMFGLDDQLDGDQLAAAVFGQRGPARALLGGPRCEGYMSLFKGLYALQRNPVFHNDMTPDQQEAEAALMLLNSALAQLESARPVPGRPSRCWYARRAP